MKKIITLILGVSLSFVIPLNGYAETYSINPSSNQFFENKVNFKYHEIVFSDKDKNIDIFNGLNISFDVENINSNNNFRNKGFKTLAENVNSEQQDYRWLFGLILPGLGHASMGEYLKGKYLLSKVTPFTITVFSLILFVNLFFLGKEPSYNRDPDSYSNKYYRWKNALYSPMIYAIYSYVLYDAFLLSKTLKEEEKIGIKSFNFNYPIMRF